MEDFEKYKSELIGEKLIKILHTDQGEGVEHLNGLGYAYYFSTVLELENGKKYRFGNDWINKWDESERLSEVTHKNWNIEKSKKFNNVRISDIIIDDYDEIYIKLENGILIYHTMDYGDQLFFDKYSDLFNSDGKLIEENTTANNNHITMANEVQPEKSINKSNFWSKLKNIWS